MIWDLFVTQNTKTTIKLLTESEDYYEDFYKVWFEVISTEQIEEYGLKKLEHQNQLEISKDDSSASIFCKYQNLLN